MTPAPSEAEMVPIADVIAYHDERAAYWAKLYAETPPTTEAIELQRDRLAARSHEHMNAAAHFRAIAARLRQRGEG